MSFAWYFGFNGYLDKLFATFFLGGYVAVAVGFLVVFELKGVVGFLAEQCCTLG